MANEFFQRHPTAEGNPSKWTWSAWLKSNVDEEYADDGGDYWHWLWSCGNVNNGILINYGGTNWDGQLLFYDSGGSPSIFWDPLLRDSTGWYHIVVSYNSHHHDDLFRVKAYVNGIELNRSTDTFHSPTQVGQNANSTFNTRLTHAIGRWEYGSGSRYLNANLCDMYLLDGQVCGPETFGFRKQGYGIVKHNNLHSEDDSGEHDGQIRYSGAWLPKNPHQVRNDVKLIGGFGTNGYYLPMNSGKNPGADFHLTPDSILQIKSDSPQPKAELKGDPKALVNHDPLAEFLVLAVPGVKDGLGGGFGDYSHLIRNNGTNPHPVQNNGTSIAESCANGHFYGSSMEFGANDYLDYGNSDDFFFGDKSFTIEFWRKRSRLNATEAYVTVYDGSSNNHFWFGATHTGYDGFWYYYGSGSSTNIQSGSSTQDQWDHLCAERDADAGTITFYRNGNAEGVRDFTSGLNAANNLTLRIGKDNHPTNNYSFSGYISDLRIYKGVAKYKGGFDVPKPYNPKNFASETFRESKDTPRKNYAKFLPESCRGLSNTNRTIEGGTRFQASGNNAAVWVDQPFPNYGKWYMEITLNDGDLAFFFEDERRCNYNHQPGNSGDYGIGCYLYYNDGTNRAMTNGSTIGNNFPSSWIGGKVGHHSQTGSGAVGEVYRVLVDRDSKIIRVINPGGVEGSFVIPAYYDTRHMYMGYTVTTTWPQVDMVWNFGQRTFTHNIPEGYKELHSQNLKVPIKNPTDHFDILTYQGNGEYGRQISGLSFKPDLVWLKERTSVSHWAIFDVVRGVGKRLFFNNRNHEESGYETAYMPSLNQTGFSVGTDGSTNQDGQEYIAYCWKAGGNSVKNDEGVKKAGSQGIITDVSANPEAGFSVVRWTGSGQSTSVSAPVELGHGLNDAPKFVITKIYSGGNTSTTPNHWWYYFEEKYGDFRALRATMDSFVYAYQDGQNALRLSLDENKKCLSATGGFTTNNVKYVAYCWAEIPQYSKFGVYRGNGDAGGEVIFTGFKPAFLIIHKLLNNSNSASGDYMVFVDSARNPTNMRGKHYLHPALANGDDIENGTIDFLSSGFRIRSSDNIFNTSDSTYFYAAWAESPFTNSTAK